MVDRMVEHWWIPVVRGALAILFGLAALAWPDKTIFALIVVFGAFSFVDGVMALVSAVRFASHHERWVVLSLEGLAGVLFGLVALIAPAIVAFFFAYFVAGWAIVTGIFELVAAVRVRSSLANELFLISSGVLSVVLGVFIAALPYAGLVAWVWLIGIYAILFGGMLIAFGVRLRGHGSVPA